MKVLAWILLASLAAASMSGCGRKPAPSKPPPTPPPVEQRAVVPEAPAQEDAEAEETDGENSFTFSYTPGEEKKGESGKNQNKEPSKITAEQVKVAPPEQKSGSKKSAPSPTAPQESAAALLATPTPAPDWRPAWRSDGVGGSCVADARLTPDNSLLITAETFTGKDDKKGTRIVALSTYDWKVLRNLQFEGKLITKIRTLADCISIAYSTEAQKTFKTPSEVGVIHLERETPSFESAVCGYEISDICPDRKGELLLVKAAPRNPDSPNLHVFSLQDMKQKKSFSVGVTSGALAVSIDNAQFAIAGPGAVEFYGVGRGESLRSVKLGADYIPTATVFTRGEKMLAVMALGQPAYFFKGAKCVELCDLSGHTMCLDESNDTLIVERRVKNSLCFFKLPELEKVDEFSPNELKPATAYPALLVGYLPHLKKHMTFDKGGNLCLYSKDGKKWRKELVFSCEK